MDHAPTQLVSRRRAIRMIGGGAALVAAATLVRPTTVGARRVWCRADPTFQIDDLIGNVYVSGELDRAYDTTGPIQLHFIVPEGTNVGLLASDNGFGYGYDIVHRTDGRLKKDHKKIEIEVEVFVPATTDKLPVMVEFVPGTTVEVEDHKEGGTNKWIKVKTQLKKPKETAEQKAAREAAEKAAKDAEKAAEEARKAAEEAAEVD